jgi:lipid-A-disaccharide synthase
MVKKKQVFIIAGEASGDIIGASLARELIALGYVVEGIGGDLMRDSGCKITFHYENIAVMGLTEVILARIKRYMSIAIETIMKFEPDVIVTIDSPGFNFRIIKSLRKKIKFNAIHYVAPTVWAYGQNRVKVIKLLYDHILLILPFETQYFSNMDHTFVGHPIIEDTSSLLGQNHDIHKFDKMKLMNKIWNISIMVGSRLGEIKRHTGTIIRWIDLMRKEYKNQIIFHFLTLPHLVDHLNDNIKQYTNNFYNIYINADPSSHNKIIQESILGLVKSGTATMRFMANGTPAITFYKVSKITELIMRFRLKINKFNLCNIITNSFILQELMQDDFNPENLFIKSQELLTTSRSNIIDCYLKTWNMLKQEELPSRKAAETIKQYL